MLKNTLKILLVLATSAFAAISSANAGPGKTAAQVFDKQNAGSIVQKIGRRYSRYYDLRHILRDRGFYRIRQTDAYNGRTYFRACRDGVKFHIVINYRGRILSCVETGYCGRRHYRRYRYSYGYW